MEGLPPRAERTDTTKDPASGALLLAALGLFSLGTLAVAGLFIGVRALIRAFRQPAKTERKANAVVAIVANLLVLYVSFVAVRGLLRAHVSTAEATAIGDIRTMIAAQAAYASLNDGRYEPRLECLLERPSACPATPRMESRSSATRWRPCGRRAATGAPSVRARRLRRERRWRVDRRPRE